MVLKDSILYKDTQEEGLPPQDEVNDLLDLQACLNLEDTPAEDQDGDEDEDKGNFDSIDVEGPVSPAAPVHNLRKRQRQ
jgi:hypothetical protein